MAYNTPELLLVGAAQNLVLGPVSLKSGIAQIVDDDTLHYVEELGPDSRNW